MDSLHQSRLERADLTQGLSSNVIYDKTLNLIQSRKLTGSVLEFGAGSGTLLRRIFKEWTFSRLVGVDILERPNDLSERVEWVQVDLNYPIPIPSEGFDLILSTEVIEHLENPRAVAREWFRLLKPSGTLIMTTPNQESIRSYCGMIFGGHYVAFLGKSYPAHITALLRLDIQRILEEAGFSNPRFSFTNLGGIPKMPYLSWQQISGGLLKGRLWSDNLLVTAEKRP